MPLSARSAWSFAAAELKRRRAAWKAPKPYAASGVLAKYASLVGSASQER